MRAWFAGCIAPFVWSVTASSAAAEPGIAWRCVQQYDQRFHARCTPLREGVQEPDAVSVADTSGAPLELRPVAQRGHAEVYSTDAWLVPLHTKPSDASLVVDLLQSVLCGKHPACTVAYGGPAPHLARR